MLVYKWYVSCLDNSAWIFFALFEDKYIGEYHAILHMP